MSESTAFSSDELRDIGVSFASLDPREAATLAEALKAFGDDSTPWLAAACADVIKARSLTQPPTLDQCLAHFVEARVLLPLDSVPRTPAWVRAVIVRAIFGAGAGIPDGTPGVTETFERLIEAIDRVASHDRRQSRDVAVPSAWLVHHLITSLQPDEDDDERDDSPSAVASVRRAVRSLGSESADNGRLLGDFLMKYITALQGAGLWSPLGRLQWSAEGRLLHDLMPVVGSFAFALGTSENAPALRAVVGRVLQASGEFGADGLHHLGYLVFCLNVSTAVARNDVEPDEDTRARLLAIACAQLAHVEPNSTAEGYCATVNEQIRVSLFAVPELAIALTALLDYEERTKAPGALDRVVAHLAYSLASVSKTLYVSDVGSDRRIVDALFPCVRLLDRLVRPDLAAASNRRPVVNHLVISCWRLLGIVEACLLSDEVSDLFRDLSRVLDRWQGLIPDTKEHEEAADLRRRIDRAGGFPLQALSGLATDFKALWRSAIEEEAGSIHRERFVYYVNLMMRLLPEARARDTRNYVVRYATKELAAFLRSGASPRELAERSLAAIGLTYD
jgi:hypothetical protein